MCLCVCERDGCYGVLFQKSGVEMVYVLIRPVGGVCSASVDCYCVCVCVCFGRYRGVVWMQRGFSVSDAGGWMDVVVVCLLTAEQ